MEKSDMIQDIGKAIQDGTIKGKFMNGRRVFEFDPVENIGASGNVSKWVISVYALDRKTRECVPIKKEYIEYPVTTQPKDIEGAYQTQIKRHTGRIQVNEETIVTDGKNIGKLNATTPVSQAFKDAYGKYKQRVKTSKNKINANTDIRPSPMRLKKTGATRSAVLTEDDFKLGVAVQPKLNGVHAVAHMLSDCTIEFYSRVGNAIFGLDHISSDICEILSKYDGETTDIYFDGELYIHGTPLQEIAGAVRGPETNELKSKMEFHLFDILVRSKEDMTQKDRIDLLCGLIKKKYKYVKLIPTKIVHSREELDKMYEEYIEDERYEGVVARRLSGVYKTGEGKQSSSDVVKIKPFFNGEFDVVDYKDGKGRDSGAVTFILKTDKGDEFAAVPNMTLKDRKELFSKFERNPKEFDQKYRGKKATIQYATLSTKGVPTQPKWVVLRDYE